MIPWCHVPPSTWLRLLHLLRGSRPLVRRRSKPAIARTEKIINRDGWDALEEKETWFSGKFWGVNLASVVTCDLWESNVNARETRKTMSKKKTRKANKENKQWKQRHKNTKTTTMKTPSRTAKNLWGDIDIRPSSLPGNLDPVGERWSGSLGPTWSAVLQASQLITMMMMMKVYVDNAENKRDRDERTWGMCWFFAWVR